MAHKMGLVRLNPTTKSVATTLTYTYDKADGGYTSSTSGTSTITASNDFTGNKPFYGNSQYGYIVKATSASENTAVSFTCNAQQKDFWTAKPSGTDVGHGKYKVIDIQSDRNAANFVALFSCVKKCQEITLPWYDTYKMECWGASGGTSPQGSAQVPGRGGYTRGNITLGKSVIYVYVGGQGYSNVNSSNLNNAGGWNGGGASSSNSGAPFCGSGGGGSTDIRIAKHSNGEWGWNSSSGADASLRTRIMVAAGGGGCDGYYGGGHGGGTTGGTSTTTHSSYTVNTGATQTSTGSQTLSSNWRGYFGYGNQVNNANGNGGGGGGGWWAGSNGYGTGGSGGSSFISGMSGCVAINSSGVQTSGISIMTINGVTYQFTGTPVTYSGGDASRPANPGEGSNTYGNGYAKITSQ